MSTDGLKAGIKRSTGRAGLLTRKAPTMADVARRATVSTAAVSYFLSGDRSQVKRVGADAQSRILKAVAELGYVQNGAARQLRRRQADRICLILPRLGVPYSDRIAQDIQTAAQARGLSTIIAAGADYDAVERVFLEVEGGLADGMIAELQHLTPVQIDTLTRRLIVANKPMIIFHPTMRPKRFCVLRQDAANAILQALQSLYDAGHRRVAYIQHAALGEKTRVNAYLTFLASVGLPFDPSLMLNGAESRRTAHQATLALLQMAERPTAVFVESDFAAITALNTFRASGLSVPSEVAIIGCGNIDEGQFSFPALTTIGPESPTFTHLADHIADLIEGKRVARSKIFELPWSVIRRNSA
jgi:DNA-binding LacI/PurR family transcriptional regulator